MKFARPATILAGQAFSFTVSVFHATNGIPVTDMSPLWGAQAHVAIVKHDLSYIEHAHAMGTMTLDMRSMQMMTDSYGPDTGGEMALPEGTFRIVFQMSRGNAFVFTPSDSVVSPTTVLRNPGQPTVDGQSPQSSQAIAPTPSSSQATADSPSPQAPAASPPAQATAASPSCQATALPCGVIGTMLACALLA